MRNKMKRIFSLIIAFVLVLSIMNVPIISLAESNVSECFTTVSNFPTPNVEFALNSNKYDATFYWASVDGADSYTVNVYNPNGILFGTADTTSTSAVVAGLPTDASADAYYTAQVIAKSGESTICTSLIKQFVPYNSSNVKFKDIKSTYTSNDNFYFDGNPQPSTVSPDGDCISMVATGWEWLQGAFYNVPVDKDANYVAFWLGQDIVDNCYMTSDITISGLVTADNTNNPYSITNNVQYTLVSTDTGLSRNGTRTDGTIRINPTDDFERAGKFINGYVIISLSSLANHEELKGKNIHFGICFEMNERRYYQTVGDQTANAARDNKCWNHRAIDNVCSIKDLDVFLDDVLRITKNQKANVDSLEYKISDRAFKAPSFSAVKNNQTGKLDATITWDAVDTADSYKLVVYQPDGLPFKIVNTNSVSATVSDLPTDASADAYYTAQVIAKSGDNIVSASLIKQFIPYDTSNVNIKDIKSTSVTNSDFYFNVGYPQPSTLSPDGDCISMEATGWDYQEGAIYNVPVSSDANYIAFWLGQDIVDNCYMTNNIAIRGLCTADDTDSKYKIKDKVEYTLISTDTGLSRTGGKMINQNISIEATDDFEGAGKFVNGYVIISLSSFENSESLKGKNVSFGFNFNNNRRRYYETVGKQTANTVVDNKCYTHRAIDNVCSIKDLDVFVADVLKLTANQKAKDIVKVADESKMLYENSDRRFSAPTVSVKDNNNVFKWNGFSEANTYKLRVYNSQLETVAEIKTTGTGADITGFIGGLCYTAQVIAFNNSNQIMASAYRSFIVKSDNIVFSEECFYYKKNAPTIISGDDFEFDVGNDVNEIHIPLFIEGGKEIASANFSLKNNNAFKLTSLVDINGNNIELGNNGIFTITDIKNGANKVAIATLTVIPTELKTNDFISFTSSDETIIARNINVVKNASKGDINNDGNVNIVDLVRFKKYAASSVDKNGFDEVDVNDDGILNYANDLAQLIVKLIQVSKLNQIGDIVYYKNNDGSVSSDYPDFNKLYGLSKLSDTSALKFFHKGKNYAYGITQDNKEVISLIDENNGNLIDVLSGAGTVSLNTAVPLFTDTVKYFESSFVDGSYTLSVYYMVADSAETGTELITDYIFKDNGISVTQKVKVNSKTVLSSGSVIRRLLRSYSTVDKQIVGKWHYPSNGDYPYQVNESIATSIKIDDYHTVHTFCKDVKEDYLFYPNDYPNVNIPVSFTSGNYVDFSCNFELVMSTDTGDSFKDKYKALFSGKSSDFAVGVYPNDTKDYTSSVFVGDSVDLNLNVTNLIKKDIDVSLNYDVRDYYGNIVDSGSFKESNCPALTEVNRKIHISGNYGMYYINLYAKSGKYKYQECYPLALVKKSDYTYRSTNPFGLTSIDDHGSLQDALTAANIAIKIGAGNYRLSNLSETAVAAARKMVNAGMSINVQLSNFNTGDSYQQNISDFKNIISAQIESIKDIAASIEVGNEIDGAAHILHTTTFEKLMPEYVNGTLIPAGEVIRSYGLKSANAASAGTTTQWFSGIGDAGAWNSFDILSTHSYGIPYMPDIKANQGNVWNFESGCQRAVSMLKKYGNKEWYMSETGYPTSAKNSTYPSIRTQADYDTRIYIIGHSYGANRIQLYNFYDRSAWRQGYDNSDSEQNYGLCYQPDFLDVVKPKPIIAAIAAISRITDGLQKTEECKITSSNDTRTFKMSIKGGKILYAAWSNKYPLPNGMNTTTARAIGMPWKNEYSSSEAVEFNAVGNTVKVYDLMGNSTVYNAKNGKVTINLTGSPVYIEGVN